MLFVDTSSGDQSDVIAGAYEVAGPDVPLVGGAAGGAEPAQLALGTARRDRVVAVAVVSPDPIGVGIAHGCSPCAVPSIVTRAEGRVVVHLDGRPAEQVYLEKLGYSDSDALGRRGVRAPGHRPPDRAARAARRRAPAPRARPHGGGRPGMRDPHPLGRRRSSSAARRPTRSCAAPSTPSARRCEPLHGPARAALVFDCAGRRSALGGPGESLDGRGARAHVVVRRRRAADRRPLHARGGGTCPGSQGRPKSRGRRRCLRLSRPPPRRRWCAASWRRRGVRRSSPWSTRSPTTSSASASPRSCARRSRRSRHS